MAAEIDDFGVVGIGIEDEVELRLLFVLNEDGVLLCCCPPLLLLPSFRMLCAESVRFKLLGDFEYKRLPVLRLNGERFEQLDKLPEVGERIEMRPKRPVGGLPEINSITIYSNILLICKT